MHEHHPSEHAHHHDFGVIAEKGERRTRWVVGLTLATMIVELVTGYVTGSMALTADGWHMATHAGALGLALFAYWFARTRARSAAFSFGTGKVYALAGYTSGVALGMIALWMAIESAVRMFEPHAVHFGEALPVAIIGLAVNLVSAVLLGHGHDHGPGAHAGTHGGHTHAHGRDAHMHGEHTRSDEPHVHVHEPHADEPHVHGHAGHSHEHDRHDQPHSRVTDHNLRAAYLHVIADALTSVLAIVALLAGEYAGIWWLDPAMGFLGGALIARWSIGLCRDASRQLLDVVPTDGLVTRIESRLERLDDVKVADLHLWELAPGKRGCIVSLVSAQPREVEYYRREILAVVELAHLTVEVHRCTRGHAPAAPASAAG
jgi:cation diffusion facilitator family transporter